jgi:selenide,water dikinase
MRSLEVPADARVLVGMNTSDDAGVFALEGYEQVLVQTVDFITPVCDDPYWFGRVAAANSLSDIYAMGARPITAMNICCFPAKGPSKEQYTSILRGGMEVVTEAGAAVVGGQTVKDEDLKYGLAVTGLAKRDEITTNAGARAGDRLILTKPIGTGVLIGAYKAGKVDEDILLASVRNMALTNADAAAAMVKYGCKGATDITGFGLAGHAWEMAEASGVRIVLDADAVPVYGEAVAILEKRGKLKPIEWAHGNISCDDAVPLVTQHLSADPQTSGGLLIAVAGDKAEALLSALHERGIEDAAMIGRVEGAEAPGVRIVTG